jgi:hypothetical protein
MTVALAVAVAAPTWAQGQGRGQGRGFGAFGGGALQLIQIPEVQTELKLTDEQKGKFQQMGQEMGGAMREMFQALQNAAPEERQKKLQEFQADANKKINAVLNADQQKRLRQLVLQRQGPAVLAQDESVAKDLKVTDEQKQKIAAITREAGEQRRALLQGGGLQNPETRAKMEEITKQTNEKITATLTDAQKKQWKEMLGAEFKFPEVRRRQAQ